MLLGLPHAGGDEFESEAWDPPPGSHLGGSRKIAKRIQCQWEISTAPLKRRLFPYESGEFLRDVAGPHDGPGSVVGRHLTLRMIQRRHSRKCAKMRFLNCFSGTRWAPERP